MTAWKRWAAVAASSIALAAAAQAPYPNKPIKWIVPYTPGGITDSVTRIVTQKLSEALGQPIVIENKPGANSIVGAEAAAKSPPDGYTVVTVIGGHAANATLYAGRLSFDPVKSFAPISLAGIAPLIMTANNNFPVKDVKELVDYAKANPGKVSFGSSGVGSATHLTFELLKQTAGINMVHIPYKGTAPALAAELAGDIQVLGDVPSSLMPHVRAGKIKALALFSSKRSAGAPEVPTIAEAGGPAIEGSTWVLFLAPAGTPPAIVSRISSEVAKIVQSPEMKARFEQLGIEAVGSTPQEAGKFLEDEVAKWAKVITTAGVKAE
jgi:tripartite-type tricarboxylate transporter receptor subunit TctC